MASRFRALTKGAGVKLVQSVAGTMRNMGKSLDKMGANMEVAKFTEKLVPSTQFVAVDGVVPKVPQQGANFFAPTASVIGDVTIGKESSIWYGAKVRGDVNQVTIGKRSHIMDRAVVHVAKIQGDLPTSIGNNVIVGAGALVHAATLEDGCIVGEGAQVLDGATVQSHAIVAPGSVVTPKTVVASGEYWAGSPAKKVRSLSTDEIAKISEKCYETSQLASVHLMETYKGYVQVKEEEEMHEILESVDESQIDARSPEERHEVLGQGQPGRIYNSTLTNPEEGLDVAMRMKYQK